MERFIPNFPLKLKYHQVRYTLFLLLIFVFRSNISAQDLITITGNVVDAVQNQGIPGVTVQIKNSTQGTFTNENGSYSIQAKGSDVLIFSFLGFETQEVTINNRTEINVTLSSSSTRLQEVVAVGYQTKTRGEITSAISAISGQAVTETAENNITQAIQGKIPGMIVNDRGGGPGSDNAEFLIRGKSTLGDNSPLIVIDGVPRSTDDFSRMAPNDIESISVLKDASAAIYGARASNGVILITTKKGKIGKASITLSSDYGIQRLSKFPEAMSSYERAVYFNEENAYNGLPPLWSDDALMHFQKGDEPLLYPNTNWKEEVLSNTAPETHHNLSIRGGTDKIQYYVSGDLQYQMGLLKSRDMHYQQMQVRSNITATVAKGLKIGANLMGRRAKNHGPVPSMSTIFGHTIDNYPWVVAHWPDGSFPPGLEDFGNTPYTDSHAEYGTYDLNEYIVNSTFNAEYQIPGIEGLKVSGYASFDFNNQYEKAFTNTWDVFNYDPGTDTYTRVSGGSSTGVRNGLLSQKGSRQVIKNNTLGRQDLYHFQIDYLKSFGQHNLNAFIAYERSTVDSSFLSAYRQDLPSASIPYLFTGGQAGKDNNGFLTQGGRINYFGSIGYNYAQKYMIDFTFRHDGSFNFAPNRRFGNFPSVSAGWNITKEPFMEPSDWLNNLKIRASWGKMGNDRIPSYQYLTIYGLTDFFAFGINPTDRQELDITQIANPNITWEKSTQTDIGIDLTGWNSLLDLSLDVFWEKRKDILIARHASVPAYTALVLPDENLGRVNNSGVELSMNHSNTVGPFKYHLGGNLTYNRDKIVFMDEAKDIPDYQRQEGHPLDSWLVYETDGVYQNQAEIDASPHLPGTQPGDIKYIDVDEDGQITGNDMVRKYSSATPRLQYAFQAGVTFKNISLDVFFQGQALAKQDVFYSEGVNSIKPFYDKRWTPDNPTASFPRAFDRDDDINVRPSTLWLYDASFLRFKNLRVMYNFPESTIKGISNLNVYFTARNLVTWDKMLGNWDPERTSGSGYGYPQIQEFTFGFNVTF